EMIVSLNPPVPYDTNMPAFFESIKNFCARSGMLEHVEITHSATAIDIAPRGVNKMQALQEVLNGDMSLYFGDAKNDEEAMGISVVNSVPDNASESTKDTAKRSSSFGLLSKKSELAGVVDALWNVELYFRFVKIKHKQQSTPQSK
ncbi:MAG TPA: HAD hydrolase family protein, partial [Patescibacteria group bacterium]|nr:HAD hydrolase family protein [Patescibacteria group bacterium]